MFFTFIPIILLLPTCSPQVIGWGTLNSIGKAPIPLSLDFPTKVNGINNDHYSWPDGIIPYNFDFNSKDTSDNSTLTSALAAQQVARLQWIMNSTCVRFVPRTNETDHITFRFSSGCTSSGGRVGGQQHVSLQKWCFPDTHELMHSLGFIHEQQRRDRDYYIAFNWTNLDPNYYSTYSLINYPTFGTVLDPVSTLMYMGWYGHMNKSFPVSIYKDGSDPRVNAAFRLYSEGDRHKINRRYNCNADDNCWDEDPFNCPVWAAAGGCKTPNWVPNVCPNKCCFDIHDNLCPRYLKEDGPKFCNTSWAQKRCNVTCNFCPNKPDQRSDCQYIRATLGCSSNVSEGGMGKYCRQSCGICTRPAKVTIKPMIITKCPNTCHPQCTTNNGCNLTLPPNSPDFDKTKPLSQCITLPAKSGLTTSKWCASNTWAQKNCQTTCNIRNTCPPQCVDQDKANCPKLAATLGCFSIYNL